MKLEITAPDRILFAGEIEAATFPGIAGSFDILPHHAPLIAALGAGVIRYERDKQEYEQPIQSGFIEVKDNRISVCIE